MVDFTNYRKRPATPWHNAKSMVGPDGTLVPAPAEEAPKPKAPEPIGLPAYVKENTPAAAGWRRVVEHIRYLKSKGEENEDQVRTATQKFVQDYPGSVRRVDNDYWTGMQLALDAYVSQDKAFWRNFQ